MASGNYVPEVHSANYKERTNSGKQTVAFAASVLWDNIPVDLKKPICLQFFQKIKTLSAVRTTF